MAREPRVCACPEAAEFHGVQVELLGLQVNSQHIPVTLQLPRSPFIPPGKQNCGIFPLQLPPLTPAKRKRDGF